MLISKFTEPLAVSFEVRQDNCNSYFIVRELLKEFARKTRAKIRNGTPVRKEMAIYQRQCGRSVTLGLNRKNRQDSRRG